MWICKVGNIYLDFYFEGFILAPTKLIIYDNYNSEWVSHICQFA